jgi:hypothetical protein
LTGSSTGTPTTTLPSTYSNYGSGTSAANTDELGISWWVVALILLGLGLAGAGVTYYLKMKGGKSSHAAGRGGAGHSAGRAGARGHLR